jgi:hypothetical protein
LFRLADRNQAKHLELAARERLPVHRRLAFLERVETHEIRCGSQLLKDGSGQAELECSRLLIAERSARQSYEHAHACRGVWHLDLLPRIERATQWTERALRIALGQCDGAAAVRSHRAQGIRVDDLRDFLKFPAGAACFLNVARSQHDFNIGWQQSRSLQPVGG